MKRITLVAAGLAALVLTAGTAAALPGNAPVDAGANANDAADGDGRDVDRAGGSADAREGGPAGASEQADRGPPVDLPAQVPDHVSQIHDLIREHLSGNLAGSLGEAINDVTPSDDADETAGDATDTGSDGNDPSDDVDSGNETNA